MNKIGGALAIVAVACVLYFGVGSIDADPPDVSSFMTASTPPDDDDNAWCGFVAATNAVKRRVGTTVSAWDKFSPDELDALVAENAEAIGLFQNAARRATWYVAAVRSEKGFVYLFPSDDFIELVKLYRAKAERQIARGEIREAVEAADDLMTLSRTIQSDAESIVWWLVAGGARDMALDLAFRIVASGRASDEELRALLGALALTDVPTLREGVRRAVDNDFLYVFVEGQRSVEEEMRSTWTSRLASRFAYHPNRTKAFYAEMAGKAKDLLSRDYDRGEWKSFESEIRAATPKRFGSFTPNHEGWRLLAVCLPAYDELAGRLARGEFSLSAAKVVVAAELSRRKAFTRYIRENPMRHWLRKSNREYFRRVGEVEFLGRKWYGYGNAAIMDQPVLEPFRCSRKWVEGGAEWLAAIERAKRIGPGGAGVGTFMSPCEKACGNAIACAGGRLVVLSPESFGPRWHPGRRQERYCAEGRMLFLSLYPEMARQPTHEELYRRCHEMGAIVLEGLSVNRRGGNA